MNRIRTKDLVKDLGDLEEMARKRSDWLAHYCKPHPLLSEHSVKVFQGLQRHEGNLVEKFAFMRQKLGWVLEDMNHQGDTPVVPKAKPALPCLLATTSPASPQPLPPILTAREFRAQLSAGKDNPPDQRAALKKKELPE